MKNILILIVLFNCVITYSQTTGDKTLPEEFDKKMTEIKVDHLCVKDYDTLLQCFPKYEWNDLRVEIEEMKGNVLDYKLLNRYMFCETCNKKKQTYHMAYPTWSPHYILPDGKLASANSGMFSESDISTNKLYGLARIHVNDSIVCLIIHEYYAWSNEIYAYTINMNSDILLSSVTLHKWDKDYFSFMEQDYRFKTFFLVDLNEDDVDSPYIKPKRYMEVFKLRPDGYFENTEFVNRKTTEKYKEIYFKDNDGYANVRKEPNVNSEVLYKVKDSVLGMIEYIPNSNWCKVIFYREPDNRSIVRNTGYIHKSRFIILEKK